MRNENNAELHEVFVAVPPPQDAPPPPPLAPITSVTKKKRGKGCLWAVLITFTVLLGGCTTVLLLASLGPVSEKSTDSSDEVVSVVESDDANGSSIAVDATLGTRDEPYAFEQLTTIEFDVFGDADGSRWNVSLSPLADVTNEVVGESQLNTDPPTGVVFAGFDAKLTLVEADTEPLAVGFNFIWEILGGATAAVYDRTTLETESFGCGITPAGFDDFAQAYVGGTVEGLVCIPLPTEDLADEKTQVALNFRGRRIHFAADGTGGSAVASPSPAKPFPAGDRLGTREEPFAFDDATAVRFETFGDADGSDWQVEIGPLVDVGDIVLESNQFNKPPPAGVVYAGFEADMTLLAAQKEPLAPGLNYSWEVIGGATARAYGIATLDTKLVGCGATAGAFDVFSEVFASGSIEGLVCIPIPVEDLTHPNTRVAMNFTDGDRIHFGP